MSIFKRVAIVEVLNGSLKGIKGEVANIYGQVRLLIRVNSLNCSLYANISREDVKLIEENSAQRFSC